MVLGRKRFGTVVLAVGVILLLVGLLAMPVGAQTNESGNQYTDKVCEAVINIIIGDGLDSSIDQYVGGDNINDIAQELNIPPSIVQQCAEEGGVNVDDGDDNGNDDGDDNSGPNENDGSDDVVPGSVPSAASLPKTGGLEVFLPVGALLVGASLTMSRMVLQRK